MMPKKPRALKPVAASAKGDKWVSQWQSKIISDAELPQPAQEELFESTTELKNILVNNLATTTDRCIKGMVVGNVQSGKTASMIGLTATAFDLGFDIVIILTGNDNILRQQTHSRFNYDLFQYNDEIKMANGSSFDPIQKSNPGKLGKSDTAISEYVDLDYQQSLTEYLKGNPEFEILKSVKRGNKILLTALKLENLTNLGEVIRQVNTELEHDELPGLQVMVIDDESDFGSAAGKDAAKIQHFIRDLWVDSYKVDIGDDQSEYFETFPGSKKIKLIQGVKERQAVYIGYTATPHGVLKNRFNSFLKPEDFIFTLKASGGFHDTPDLEPSERVYYNAETPVKDWYCGGHVYYKYLENEEHDNFLVESINPVDNVDLVHDKFINSVCDYLTSAAIRWLEEKETITETDPITQTMFIHNHAKTHTHYSDILRFIYWIAEKNGILSLPDAMENLKKQNDLFLAIKNEKNSDDRIRDLFSYVKSLWENGVKTENGGLFSPKSALITWLETNEGLEHLKQSYDSFQQSRSTILSIQPGCRDTEELPDFEEVVSVVKTVVKLLKIRFINRLGCRELLNFDSTYTADDQKIPPFDALSIVIGGNMLGRGVTLKNLAVTYFQKSADKPSQDTYIQRQRWFGYRGNMIEFCRVYAPDETIEFLAKAHNDLELAIERWSELYENNTPLVDPSWWTIMTSTSHSISSKSMAGTTINLNHWVTPTYLVESPNLDGITALKGDPKIATSNLENQINMIAHVIQNGRKLDPLDLPHPGQPDKFHGYLLGSPLNCTENCGEPLSSNQLADFLDGFRFTNHHPSPKSKAVIAFDQLAKILSLSEGSFHTHFESPPNFRDAMNPQDKDSMISLSPASNPFLIAAYLRYWSALWDAHTQNNLPNSVIDSWEPTEPPKFNVVAWTNNRGKKTPITIKMKDKSEHQFNTYHSFLGTNGTNRSHFIGLPKGESDWGGWANLDNFSTDWKSEKQRKRIRKSTENGIVVLRILDKSYKNKDNENRGVCDAEHRPKIWINIPEGGPDINFVI